MGSTFIRGFLEDGMDIDKALEIHLQYNHYPPVDLAFIPACKMALEFANMDDWNEKIKLPNGRILDVADIVEGLHLDAFLEYIEE